MQGDLLGLVDHAHAAPGKREAQVDQRLHCRQDAAEPVGVLGMLVEVGFKIDGPTGLAFGGDSLDEPGERAVDVARGGNFGWL